MMTEEIMDLLIAYWNGEMEEEEVSEAFGEPNYGPRGKCVDIVQAAYGDWYIYEDGHEEYVSLGD